MSENTTTDVQSSDNNASNSGLKIGGLYAFKEGMSTVYNEAGEAIPVTVLRYEPWFVSQVKTVENDGYQALQLACRPRKEKNADSASKGHFKKAGLENGAQFVKEFKGQIPSEATLGQLVSIDSLVKGDTVRVTSTSKGKGFAGSIKRYGFAGGPATHGSHFHRQPGSSGNRTWPGRVMPGKKFPGHMGDRTITVKNVQIVEVRPDENVVLVKGPVPGARNSLVKMVRD